MAAMIATMTVIIVRAKHRAARASKMVRILPPRRASSLSRLRQRTPAHRHQPHDGSIRDRSQATVAVNSVNRDLMIAEQLMVIGTVSLQQSLPQVTRITGHLSP